MTPSVISKSHDVDHSTVVLDSCASRDIFMLLYSLTHWMNYASVVKFAHLSYGRRELFAQRHVPGSTNVENYKSIHFCIEDLNTANIANALRRVCLWA